MSTRTNTGRRLGGKVVTPKRQLAMVFDLNKCLGCQTCTISCKRQWTREEGMEHQWWAVVNTMPGKGTPKDWEGMGGGWKADGEPNPSRIPLRDETGDAWQFNKDEVFYGGEGVQTYLKPTNPDGSKPGWGPNWDEDEGGGE
ncbi:MAG TPA: hypothetical protein PLN78_07130, partial [Pseudomonadales bacterium]|nr:hypothetical protein [Pseudomonadales bacterium]